MSDAWSCSSRLFVSDIVLTVGPDALVQHYLATLTAASPSTVRQRRWALRELLAHAAGPDGPEPLPGRDPVGALLSPDLVTAWVDAAATDEAHPASLPGLRARASAVRALAAHAEELRLAPTGTLDALVTALAMPAPVPVPRTRADQVRRLLARAVPGRYPGAILPEVWARFCAHTHLLALTGAREDVMAGLALDAVDAGGPAGSGALRQVTTVDLAGTHRWELEGHARTAVRAWLDHRGRVVAGLQGSDPKALWVRIRPASDRFGGALRPAGLKISDRGLRLSFTTTTALLALVDRGLEEVTVADVRAYGRSDEAPAPLTSP